MKSKHVVRDSLFGVLLFVCLLKISDLALLKIIPAHPRLFPAGTTVNYVTYDFSSTASINEFGFRGRERLLQPGQIVVAGDSFTFGFGLSDGESWPELLESRLQAMGDNRAVYNLGVPGTHTLFHIWTVHKILELRPSLVVIPVVIADDIQQVFEVNRTTAIAARKGQGAAANRVKKILVTGLPGWFRAYGLARYQQIVPKEVPLEASRTVTEQWAVEASDLLEDRSLELPAALQEAALAGLINPGLLLYANTHPKRSWEFWSLLESGDAPAAAVADLIVAELAWLNNSIQSYGGRLVVMSMPSGEYMQSEFTANYRSYGANIPAENLTTTQPELMLANLLAADGIEFVPSLEWFRSNAREDIFFPTDGHLNPAGSKLMAEFVFNEIVVPSRQ